MTRGTPRRRLGALAALGLATLRMPAVAHAEEPAQGLLFRADGSGLVGLQYMSVTTSDAQAYNASTLGLGARLDLNLGYAPSRLVRLGLALGGDFSSAVARDGSIPNVDLEGWLRWSVGPRVGFRWGERLPIELELGVSYAMLGQLGGTFSIDGSSTPGGYMLDKMHGTVGSVLFLYRPAGPTGLFALHAGLTGGWALQQSVGADGVSGDNWMLTNALVLGASLGL